MSNVTFTVLYELVTTRGAGWAEALVISWGCLTEDQKELMEAAV